jgi:hypothetical protein
MKITLELYDAELRQFPGFHLVRYASFLQDKRRRTTDSSYE